MKGTPKTTRLRKVECLECGVICRMSRAAMMRSGLPTCGCGAPMIATDLDDLAMVEPDHPRLTEADHMAQEFIVRSEQQMARWARRGSTQPAYTERAGIARERAGLAIAARLARETASVAPSGGDDIPW